MNLAACGHPLRVMGFAAACWLLGAGDAFAQVANQAVAEKSEASRDSEPNRQDSVESIGIEPELPGFLDGMQITLKPRTYFLSRDRENLPDVEGWALGGALEARTGWLGKRMQMAGTLYTSQILYGPEDKDGTQLFRPGPKPITALGELHATFRLGSDTGLRIGRQSFDLPWLARHDIRMVPNTFEAVVVGRRAEKGLTYIAGYVDSIKRKNDDAFIPMSEAAGAAGTNKGLALLAGQYVFEDGSLVGVSNQATFDVMNTFFVKGEKSFRLDDELSLRAYAQYTDQRSIGGHLIGDFRTWLVSVKGELFFPHGSVRLAASRAGEGRALQSPYGGPPNYPAIIVENFDRAGEQAFMVGASYDFAGAGIPGLSVFSNISRGNTPDAGPNATPDETEYDVTLDYRFGKKSTLSGLWLRLRGAWINQDERGGGGHDFFDFRIIANYTFNIL